MTTEVATREDGRELALLKAVGLDRVAPEQRELAINIAQRYELDLLLKHALIIEGRLYITRDGLLHIAHRSGQLDGIETTEPVVVDDHWRSTCSVWRKDMSRAFVYTGRYPTKGGNQKYAPEMAVKVAEVAALRRAFDVSAPTVEERWDLDAPEATEPPPPKPTLAAVVAEKAAAVEGLGRDEFRAWYEANRIDDAYAQGVARVLFPGHKGDLDDAQRAALKARLAEGLASDPVAVQRPSDDATEAASEALGLA